jgi:O-antigen/teichoic acid export membrane protein
MTVHTENAAGASRSHLGAKSQGILTGSLNRQRVIVLIRSVGSAGFLLAARAVTVIYQLRFANHTFGASYGGLIALLNQITFYILLAELGLAAATTSLLFEPTHRGDLRRTKGLIRALQIDVRKILYILGPLSLAASSALSFALKKQVPVSTLFLSLVFTSVSALATFTALPYQSYFNAADRAPARNVILGCGFILNVALGISLATLMGSFIGLTLGTALVSMAELYVQRRFVTPRLGDEEVTTSELSECHALIRERAKYVVAHRIGYLVGYQSDYIILLLSSSLSLLGYYAQYQYLYAGLLSFALAVGGTCTAKIARRQIDLGKSSFPVFYRKTSALAAAGAISCGVLFYLCADPLVKLLYGPAARNPQVVFLFATLLMLNVFKSNDDLWIDTTGTYRTGFYLPILEALTYVLLGLLLVRYKQMTGILYAGVIVNLLFSVVLKSFVIGNGVLDRRVFPTMMIKAVNATACVVTLYLLNAATHYFTRH